jgi:hypothetical protein
LSAEYVKHSREVTTEQMQKYGKLATHDLHVPILLLYEAGKINDKNGTEVNINEEFIKHTQQATNQWIKKRHGNIFAKFKSWWNKSIDEVEAIPIIKNHNTEDVDNTVGHLKGFLYLEEIEGKLALKGLGVIKDPEAKQHIVNDKYRNTSIGTRQDGSIKEVSFVINEALAHGGLEMSEKITKKKIPPKIEAPKVSKKAMLLQEEISDLQLEERMLKDTVIPNHMILSRMIKRGSIEPWKYEDLIHQDTKNLQLMEHSLPKTNIGVMYGTMKHPTKVDPTDKVIQDVVSKFKKPDKKNKTELSELSKDTIEIIQQGHTFEEARTQELKHLKELAEYSPEIVKNYIAIELGEDIEVKTYDDKYLNEYIEKSNQIAQKINALNIQLGEELNGQVI